MIKREGITQEEYYNSKQFVNYSLLKTVSEVGNLSPTEDNPVKKINQKSTFDIGHILEKYFLEDKDLSYVYTDNTSKLTGHSKILFDSVMQIHSDLGLKPEDITSEFILEKINDLNLWGNTKSKNILLLNAEEAIDKIRFFVSLPENSIIGPENIFEIVKKMEEGIEANEEVQNTLYSSGKSETTEIVQCSIFDDQSFKLPVKARIDKVIIDDSKRTVTILDFKSMDNSADKFMSNFYQFRYYYQLPFYTKIFKNAFPEYVDYEYSMKFFVVSKKFPNVPAVYILPNEWMDKAWEGWTNKSGYKVRGIYSLMDEIEFYWMGGNTCPYLLAINNNIMTIENDWN